MERVFDKRYEVSRRIGAGGMAEVLEAHDTTLDRTVAIKVMRPELAKDELFLKQFKNEARAAAGLTSPYVVGIYDWGQNDDGCFIVMEYVRGIDLKRILKKHGAIEPAKVAEIASQVCLALSEAHMNGIVHRDIKSSNIMLQRTGDVKVMDFGIAQSRRFTSPDEKQLVLGTVHYMSPEQIQGRQAEAPSDIYSLGIVMYELTTARLPFIGSNDDIVRQQLHNEPIPPAHLNSDIDADLNDIIMKAMAKDATARYPSASALYDDLTRYLSKPEHPRCDVAYPEFWAIAVTRADDNLRGKLFKIERPCVIGRGDQADIRFPDATVSGSHARITPFGLYVEIEDLKSSNGTYVNGSLIRYRTLCQEGANVDLGNVRVRIGKKS